MVTWFHRRRAISIWAWMWRCTDNEGWKFTDCNFVEENGDKRVEKLNSVAKYAENIPEVYELRSCVNSNVTSMAMQGWDDPNRKVFEKLLAESVLDENWKQKFRSLLNVYTDVFPNKLKTKPLIQFRIDVSSNGLDHGLLDYVLWQRGTQNFENFVRRNGTHRGH